MLESDFFWPIGLELTRRTGEILVPRSCYHGNTSVLWVEHTLVMAPDFLDGFGTLLASVVDVLVMLVARLSPVVVVLVILVTLLVPVGI